MQAQDGVYVTLDELVSFDAMTRQLACTFTRVAAHLLQGNRPSRINGRSGMFDQIRQYQQGDDVRDIDWNVTARMRGVPFIRIFNEERGRPFLLLVDQTNDMFFGTRLQLKSVLAARTAALLLWLSYHKKQPYGLVLLTEEQVKVFPPRHHLDHLVHLLTELVKANQALSAKAMGSCAETQFLSAIQQLRRLSSAGSLVAMISDFHHADDPTWAHIEVIGTRSQALALPVYDGIMKAWPTEGEFLSTWGGLVAELRFSSPQIRQHIARRAEDNFSMLEQRLSESGVAIRPLSTWEPAIEQLRAALFLQGEQ